MLFLIENRRSNGGFFFRGSFFRVDALLGKGLVGMILLKSRGGERDSSLGSPKKHPQEKNR